MQIYFYDENYYFTGTKIVGEEELEFLENYTKKRVPNGLNKPKFNNNIWVEGASQNDVLKSMITYDFKEIDITDIVLLVGAYLKGGEDMFFKVLLNFWIEGKIDDKYLDNAVQFKLITKEESDFIKLTPRVEE